MLLLYSDSADIHVILINMLTPLSYDDDIQVWSCYSFLNDIVPTSCLVRGMDADHSKFIGLRKSHIRGT